MESSLNRISETEYLVIYPCRSIDHKNSLARLLDSGFNQIGEFNTDSEIVERLLRRATKINATDTPDWHALVSECPESDRKQAVAYKLTE